MLSLILGVFRMGDSRKVGEGDEMSELALVSPPVDRNEVGPEDEMNLPPSLNGKILVLLSRPSLRCCNYLGLPGSQFQVPALQHSIKLETSVLVHR